MRTALLVLCLLSVAWTQSDNENEDYGDNIYQTWNHTKQSIRHGVNKTLDFFSPQVTEETNQTNQEPLQENTNQTQNNEQGSESNTPNTGFGGSGAQHPRLFIILVPVPVVPSPLLFLMRNRAMQGSLPPFIPHQGGSGMFNLPVGQSDQGQSQSKEESNTPKPDDESAGQNDVSGKSKDEGAQQQQNPKVTTTQAVYGSGGYPGGYGGDMNPYGGIGGYGGGMSPYSGYGNYGSSPYGGIGGYGGGMNPYGGSGYGGIGGYGGMSPYSGYGNYGGSPYGGIGGYGGSPYGGYGGMSPYGGSGYGGVGGYGGMSPYSGYGNYGSSPYGGIGGYGNYGGNPYGGYGGM